MSNRRRHRPQPRLLRRGTLLGGSTIVRNVATLRVLPCCYADCWENGNKNITFEKPHENPRWPGEKLIYIFCTITHRDAYCGELAAPQLIK